MHKLNVLILGPSSFVTTLAMLIIVRAVLVIVSDGRSIYVTDQPMSNSNITSIEAKWLLELGQFPHILYFCIAVTILLWVVYEKTIFGQQLKALGGNEKVLHLAGISVNWFKIQVFAVAGFMVGLASFRMRSDNATPPSPSGPQAHLCPVKA